MSADLLRRAAANLRHHAEQAVDPLTEGAPWTVESVASGVDPDEAGVFVVAERNNLTSYIAESFLTTPHAAYVALMHPPVALALAELLKACADHAAVEGYAPAPAIVRVARAILREPS
jgi:hypothetical protein